MKACELRETLRKREPDLMQIQDHDEVIFYSIGISTVDDCSDEVCATVFRRVDAQKYCGIIRHAVADEQMTYDHYYTTESPKLADVLLQLNRYKELRLLAIKHQRESGLIGTMHWKEYLYDRKYRCKMDGCVCNRGIYSKAFELLGIPSCT